MRNEFIGAGLVSLSFVILLVMSNLVDGKNKEIERLQDVIILKDSNLKACEYRWGRFFNPNKESKK